MDKSDKAIRQQYAELGVEQYYTQFANGYENPHLPYITALLAQNRARIDFSRAFDFCCGGGEVTQALLHMNYQTAGASDPFTATLFEKNIGLPCEKWSFEDVIKGKFVGVYSAIVCSFAMHLCPEKQLFTLATTLLRHAPQLVIITPHKRPALETLDGIELAFEDFTLTERGKKVFLKTYSSFCH